ncbi:MAG: polyprenyl synthetase family protein [Halanaerobiales bacterium]|nr:polyprenyl synthetase family protein [Halanaerobiales bacterium]
MLKIDKVIKFEKNKIDNLIVEIVNKFRKKTDSSYNTIIDAMEYSLKAGGKRIRPILTVKVAEMLKGDIKAAYQAGTAIEFIHTYSLIHDDLPTIDDDDYRRGQLSNHKVFGEGIALLAGDALLTMAFELLTKINIEAEKKLKIIELISDKAGYRGMIGGQVLDIKFENDSINLNKLTKVHSLKTGALFKASILSGAYCSDFTEQEYKSLNKYGENLGLLFQITDDILDQTGTIEKLGKSTGSDQRLNKSTYPNLLGLDGAKKKAEKTLNKAKKSVQDFSNSSFLLNLVDYIYNRDH